MKKLIVFISAVAMACSLQAGNFVWGFNGGADDPAGATGWMDSGATALLYLGTVSFDSSSGWNLGGATYIASAGYDSIADAGFGHLNTDTFASNDAINQTGGQAYTLVLVDSDGITDLSSYTGDGKNYFLYSGTSGSMTQPSMTGPDVVYATLTTLDFVEASDWQSAVTSGGGGTPEPTSGLLLLIGGSLLALRRKQK